MHVVVHFYPWFNIVILPLFLGMVMYDNESRRKENKISAKDKMEPEHIHSCQKRPIKQLFFKNSRPEGTANSNKHQVQKTKFELNAGSI